MTRWNRDRNFVPTVGVCSDVGRLRTTNEDACGAFGEPEGGLLYVVADGMGGHAAGEKASRMAVEVASHTFLTMQANPTPERLRKAIEAANDHVYGYSNEQVAGMMGTTCTSLAVVDGRVHVAHAGDSRVYRITDEGITQITDDHTLAFQMQAAGLLTPGEAERNPRRNVLMRALGVQPTLEVDLIEEPHVEEGTCYLICSDGLNPVPLEVVHELVRSLPPQQACDDLVRRANERGGTDNITVMVVAFE